ncbi:MAG: FHA domain-containing protein [Planctomycetota bacterium]
MLLRLILLSGAHVGEEVEVEEEAILGRHPDCELRLHDTAASRRHARVRVEVDEAYLEDLGSSNGTRLRGRLVKEAKLEDADIIQVGETRIRVRIEMGPARAPEQAAEPRPVETPAPPPARPRPAPVVRQQAAGRGRGGALQYHRIEDRGGLAGEDLAQRSWIVRLLVAVFVVGFGSLIFYLVYTAVR